MTPDQPADHDKAEILAWLVAQRRWLAPNVVALRDREGRVVVELPRKDHALDDLATDMTDCMTD